MWLSVAKKHNEPYYITLGRIVNGKLFMGIYAYNAAQSPDKEARCAE